MRTDSFAEHWCDSHPTGGQYHVFSPTLDAGPNTQTARAGTDGYVFERGHSRFGTAGEGAVTSLTEPLNPDATYVGFFSMTPSTNERLGDGYMQFFGTNDFEAGSLDGVGTTPQTAENTELPVCAPDSSLCTRHETNKPAELPATGGTASWPV